jgi:ABC-type sugar transport system substrate-binding protein
MAFWRHAHAPLGGRRHPAAVVLGTATLLLAVLACDPTPTVGTGRSRSVPSGFVAFVGVSAQDPLWGVLRATAVREAALQSDLELKTAVPRAASANAQTDLLRDLYTPQMRGLCIRPVDAIGMREIIEDLLGKGVVVVTMLMPIASDKIILHADLDEAAVGRALAAAAVDALSDKGTVAVLHAGENTPNLRQRYLGLHQRLLESPGLTVLQEMDCDDNEFIAVRLMNQYTERFPRLNLWIAVDDWPLRRLAPGGRLLPETCQLITFNPSPDHWPLLENGTCAAIVGGRYDLVAEHAVQMCISAVRGEVPSIRTYLAPPITVTRGSLPQFREQWFKWRQSAVSERRPGRNVPPAP